MRQTSAAIPVPNRIAEMSHFFGATSTSRSLFATPPVIQWLPMDPITFRQATPQDADATVALWWAVQCDHAAYDGRTYAHLDFAACREQWLKHIANHLGNPAVRIFVAESASQLVGLIIAELADRPPIYQAPRMVEIEFAVVAAQWRKQGIFRRLLAMVEQYARENGAAMITLNVDTANPASEAYRHSGFTPRMVHMQKWLSDQDSDSP
jgi:GNAT superfamily N-acetyltransferase